MAPIAIPVDVKSPGQVFACQGFLEIAEVLLGNAEAHFDWSGPGATFVLAADGDKNPFEIVLDFLANATVKTFKPIGYVEGYAADADDRDDQAEHLLRDEEGDKADSDDPDNPAVPVGREESQVFPSGEGERNSLPIWLVGVDERRITVSHWADGSSRNSFKLYSGNRSAKLIATQMLQGIREKPKNRQAIGELKSRGVQQLWHERRDELLNAPFDVITPMGGSFNFDPRGAWTAIDAGYSPNTQKDSIAASPVVEMLAAIGLEHARPNEYETRKFRYAVWGLPLSPMLARAALSGADLKVPIRQFEFALDRSGKNKVTTFAREDTLR